MFAIMDGFEDELSLEQVKVIANPKFNDEQMQDIQDKFEEGFSINDINS